MYWHSTTGPKGKMLDAHGVNVDRTKHSVSGAIVNMEQESGSLPGLQFLFASSFMEHSA
jgi:hypothetical protein